MNLLSPKIFACAVLIGLAECGASIPPYDQVDGMRMVGVPTPDDVWAAGCVSCRDGLVWHFDGTAWADMPIVESVVPGRLGDAPGLFKVAGSGNRVWMVGGSGLVLRSVNQRPLEVSV